MGYADRIKRHEVTNTKLLAAYCQQETGIPLPSGQQYIIVNKNIKEIFKQYPQANYLTLCSVIEWAKKKGIKYSHVGNLVHKGLRFAYLEGYLPELDPRNHPNNIDNLIRDAIQVETDDYWIDRLIRSTTTEGKEATYESWWKYRESNGLATNAHTVS